MTFVSTVPTIVLVHEEPTFIGFDKTCEVLLSPQLRRKYWEKFKREPPQKVLSLSVRTDPRCVYCTLYDRNFIVRLAGYRIFRPNVPIPFPNNEVFTCGDGFYTEYFRACFSSPIPVSTLQMNTLFPMPRGAVSSTTTASSAYGDDVLELPAPMTPPKNSVKDSQSSVVFDTKSSGSTTNSSASSVNPGAIPTPVCCCSLERRGEQYTTLESYSKSVLRISPYVLERQGSHPFLRPLVLIPTPSRDCTGASAAPSVSDTSSLFAAGYITANGKELLQQQVNGEMTVPFALAASTKVADKVQKKFDARTNAFSPFSAADKAQLFSLFKSVAAQLLQKLQCTPAVLHLASPLMCCGDIHGSFRDLHTIFEQSAPFGHWSLLYAPILFLGDFVDRGPHSVEVILVLFSWAVLCPEKVHLVRGNHEDPNVNGNCDLYGDRSFLTRARAFFGDEDGFLFWQLTNLVFSFLPVAAVVDETIFACHGGIPLLAKTDTANGLEDDTSTASGEDAAADACSGMSIPTESFFEAFLTEESGGLYRFETVLRNDADDSSTAMRRRLVRELMWNDPSKREDAPPYWAAPERHQSPSGSTAFSSAPQFNAQGFRCNRCRNDASGDIHEFTESALTYFLKRFGFSLLLRAHQQKDTGVEVVKRRRIITLFSCCDYAHGSKSCAGACLICGGLLHLISWYPQQGSTSLSRFSERLFGDGSHAPSLDVQQLGECDPSWLRRFRSSGENSSTREIRAAEERFRQRPVTEVQEYG